jgi:hypothetical protein
LTKIILGYNGMGENSSSYDDDDYDREEDDNDDNHKLFNAIEVACEKIKILKGETYPQLYVPKIISPIASIESSGSTAHLDHLTTCTEIAKQAKRVDIFPYDPSMYGVAKQADEANRSFGWFKNGRSYKINYTLTCYLI